MSTSSSKFEIQMNDIIMSKETKKVAEEAVEKVEAKATENAVEQPKKKTSEKTEENQR